MPRHTEESAELFDDFVSRLRACAQPDGYNVHQLYGQAQLLRVVGPRSAILNVRTDAKENRWWGFSKKVETDLGGTGDKWFLVLLETSPAQGYLLSDVEVAATKSRWYDARTQYHIHPDKLRDLWKFRGMDHAWRRIKAQM